mmetsp:Transcript_145225/g.253462  ORF Transcript_145225/g.253462 Transcript_145225/m.253462 type:complete len:487 (+) Transcript_145225:76-1536(+)
MKSSIKTNDGEGNLVKRSDGEAQFDISSSASKYTILVALLCSICNILLGYDIGIMSVAHDFMKRDLHLTSFQDGFQVGILNAAGGIGGLLTGELADRCGRRGTMLFAAGLFFAGSVMVTIARGFPLVVAGRIVTGLGTGIGAICSPLLLAELTSPSKRGMLISWTEVINNVGICLGFAIGYSLSGMPTHIAWRVMIGLGAIPPFAIFAATFIIPESPRWLIMRGRVAEAEQVIRMVSEPSEVDEVLLSCRDAVSSEVAPWSEVLCPGRLLRTISVVGWGVPFLMAATGTESAVYFSPDIMADAGVDDPVEQYACNVIVGLIKASLLVIPMFMVDAYGRKPVLFNSVAGQAITAFLLASALYWEQGTPRFTLVALYAYIGTFSLGLSTLAFVIPPEVFPTKYRARATGVGWFINRILSSFVAIIFLPARELIGAAGVFLFYSMVSVLGVFYVVWYVPETRNLSLEECQALFTRNSGTMTSYEGDGAA